MADMILGKVVGGVAAGIGLVSEGIKAKRKQSAAKKLVAQNSSVEESGNVGESSSDHSRSIDSGRRTDEKRRSKSVEGEIPSHPPPSYEEALEYDEEQWDLDDAQHDLKLPIPGEHISTRSPDEPESLAGAAKEKPIQNVHKLTDAFMAKHPVPEYIGEAGKMGLPIVLPQRRPKDRHRGFIRAYAPILEVKGIDQETFLEFIETFDKASQASPWIQAINLANFATIPLAPPFSFLVSIGIKMAVDSATEMHSRRRTNTFLDRANTEFFRPRGLFCLVMTWNPESDQRTDTIDITSTISNRIHLQSSSTRTQRIKNQFSYSNGNTYGDIEFPEVAPLVFPALDQLADQKGEEAATKMEKLKKAKNFTSEYFDRRAVAKYAGENPDSVLAAQAGAKPTFTSRYADPNHPASNGNLISLVTGGHINPQPYMTDMQNSRMVAMDERRAMMWGGRRDMFGRDMYGRGRYAGDMYGGDMYGRDMYGRPGFGGGFGRRGRGLENTGMGMLIGALVDRGSRSQSSNQSQPPQQSLPPQQYQGYHPDEKHYPQEERQFMQQPRQPGIMGPGVTNSGSAGIMPPQQRGGPYGPGYGRGRPDPMNNPLALLNPIVGVKRILKQKVLYLMIVDMPTDEQLAAAAQELGRA